MRTLEKEGKSVDEAIWKGLQELNLPREKVRIEILDQGSKGIFGLGSRPAKVLLLELEDEEELDIRGFMRGAEAETSTKAGSTRASSVSQREKPTAPPRNQAAPARQQTQSSPAGRSGDRGTRPAVQPTVAHSTGEEAASAASVEHSAINSPPQSEASRRIAQQLQQRPQTTLPQRNMEHAASSPQRSNRPRNTAGRSDSPAPVRTASVQPPGDLTVPSEGAAARLYSFLSELFQAMELPCTIGVKREENTLQASIYGDGNDLGLLIGKHGATLDALQYLSSLVINRRQDEHLRVQIQIGDYRQRREETLTRLAERTAAKVIRDGRPVALEPMLASERRLIHMALQEHQQVETSSEGEEPNRYVVVMLKKA